VLCFVRDDPIDDGHPGNGFSGEVFGFRFEDAPVADDGVIAAFGRGEAEESGEAWWREGVALRRRVLCRRKTGEGDDLKMFAEFSHHSAIRKRRAGLDEEEGAVRMKFHALGIVECAADFVFGSDCSGRNAKDVEFTEFAAVLEFWSDGRSGGVALITGFLDVTGA